MFMFRHLTSKKYEKHPGVKKLKPRKKTQRETFQVSLYDTYDTNPNKAIFFREISLRFTTHVCIKVDSPQDGWKSKMIPCLWTSFKSIFRQDDLPEELKSWAGYMGVINDRKKKKIVGCVFQKMDGRIRCCHGIFIHRKNTRVFRGPRFWGVNSVSICRILGAIYQDLMECLSQPL